MDTLTKIDRFKARTKELTLRIIRFYQSLPKKDESNIIGKQLLRSSTSVAANYRAACRSRSEAEFYSKISIVVEEADETLFWLELIKESKIVQSGEIEYLMNESLEILKIANSIRHQKKKNKIR